MTIYLAASYARREELVEYKAQLEAHGHTVTARWLNGSHEAKAEDQELTWEQFAAEDLNDVSAAEVLVEFTEPAFTPFDTLTGAEGNLLKRGGRHVEFGYAYALGRRTLVVGAKENVFHHLTDVRVFSYWAEALAFLTGFEAGRSAA